MLAQAALLIGDDPVQTAARCFRFVRDEIAHSVDINAEKVTCSASEVLREGHGYCYAKSHLLAALLRANGVHAGFDYQRLGDGEGGFMLHGFNTVLLPGVGWYRIDARGNKEGVDAQFTPPQERLAWSHDAQGEVHYRVNMAAPHPPVVAMLRRPLTVQQLWGVIPQGL
ncbi:MAG: transglutaminase family protein [Myxococcota bacterium]